MVRAMPILIPMRRRGHVEASASREEEGEIGRQHPRRVFVFASRALKLRLTQYLEELRLHTSLMSFSRAKTGLIKCTGSENEATL